MREKVSKLLFILIKYVCLAAGAFVFIFPLVWMIVSSFKPDSLIFSDVRSFKAFIPPAIDNNFLDNYKNVLTKYSIIRSELNSLFYISIIIYGSLIVNSMAGYAFAKLKFPFKNLFFTLILMLLIIPVQVIILPLFTVVFNLGWANSYLGLIVPAIANALYIFLFRQSFMDLPDELIESAKIDGAGMYYTFFKIAVPLVKPTFATVSILIIIEKWNDFIWPVMVITDESKYTIQMAISTLYSIQPRVFGQIMAGLTFVTIPLVVIFLCMQKYYVQGIMSTGSKN